MWSYCGQYGNQLITQQTRSISICQSDLINTGTISCLPVAAGDGATVAAALHAAVAGAEDQVAVTAAAAVAGRQLHSGVHQHQAGVAADSVVAGLDQAQALVL